MMIVQTSWHAEFRGSRIDPSR